MADVDAEEDLVALHRVVWTYRHRAEIRDKEV
jgi:hypothetical protein